MRKITITKTQKLEFVLNLGDRLPTIVSGDPLGHELTFTEFLDWALLYAKEHGITAGEPVTTVNISDTLS